MGEKPNGEVLPAMTAYDYLFRLELRSSRSQLEIRLLGNNSYCDHCR